MIGDQSFTIMDVAEVRNGLLTEFKPQEKNIDTPYLGRFDGQFKLVGLSGQERIDLEEQAKVNGEISQQKFLALVVAQCLRMRSTGQQVFSAVNALGPTGKGDGIAREMGDAVYMQLVKQVAQFIGGGNAQETKNDLEQTSADLPASSLPQGSTEPSENSSTELTPVS